MPELRSRSFTAQSFARAPGTHQEVLAPIQGHVSTMYQSPRMRRLRNDRAALDRLRSESSVFTFSAQGDLPQHYRILLQGRSLWRDRGKIKTLETHHLEIKLGASYPRTIPEIRWLSPIYHPNISEIGMVCLGGYGTHWVPSVQLDELCIMLWDMARYHNYDIRSPYNRDAALWVASQTKYLFPTDSRSLRDKRVSQGRLDSELMLDSASQKPAPSNGANGLANTLAQAVRSRRRESASSSIDIAEIAAMAQTRLQTATTRAHPWPSAIPKSLLVTAILRPRCPSNRRNLPAPISRRSSCSSRLSPASRRRRQALLTMRSFLSTDRLWRYQWTERWYFCRHAPLARSGRFVDQSHRPRRGEAAR